LIGRDGEENVGRLARDLEVAEVVVLENTRMIERALDHRLRAGLAIFLQRSRSRLPALTPMRIEQP
jgi:hypothetical protein